ncbi:retropepsin-like aspartic protease family protein [Sphingomonas immobilis]|uniref:TIGR02281 family clan AA aspartic protease n=1 Tax=Sphingomonas immobilis TaxID=3063997 RepID=A0ABT8ZYQ4_9SPHN|nr:TIGR02281 family clan AA aspartic protease [Sphingomonas sp. CA1-15]MDO7842710.1 TIGR02281 family clan AA aspartic protease [Sphingomonas sp. CA1-15]
MTPGALALVLMLILPVMALAARRLPMGQLATMALAWVGIFAIAIVIVSFVSQNSSLTNGINSVFYGDSVTGSETRITKGEDGHFHARVSINGVSRTMLIDSGATTIALSQETARAAGLDLEESPFPVLVETANGTVSGKRTTIPNLKLGSIDAEGLGAIVQDNLGDQDLLGMNFLSRLKSWRVEGNTLILVPASKQT